MNISLLNLLVWACLLLTKTSSSIVLHQNRIGQLDHSTDASRLRRLNGAAGASHDASEVPDTTWGHANSVLFQLSSSVTQLGHWALAVSKSAVSLGDKPNRPGPVEQTLPDKAPQTLQPSELRMVPELISFGDELSDFDSSGQFVTWRLRFKTLDHTDQKSLPAAVTHYLIYISPEEPGESQHVPMTFKSFVSAERLQELGLAPGAQYKFAVTSDKRVAARSLRSVRVIAFNAEYMGRGRRRSEGWNKTRKKVK
eukprot:GDKI01039511.1.p1 GENE.GDKI01039511.1~~GDKI01039511.1.p1  ORF type:complete len:254 (-),score=16.58 GDKI01039511.1:233-994(-)